MLECGCGHHCHRKRPRGWDTYLRAAGSSKQYQLDMADAIIWQTAEAHSAQLYTQDAALQGLPDVVYQKK